MIITLPLIASLLFILSQATEFEHKIEPTRCGVDTACFVRKKCIEAYKNDAGSDIVLFDYDAVKHQLDGGECDVFVQMKAFSKWKYLVIMEAKPKAGSTDTFDQTSFGLHQDGQPQMVCNYDQKPSVNDAFDIESKGVDNNKLEASELHCSFFVTSKTKANIESPYEEDVDDGTGTGGTKRKFENKFPSLEFSVASAPEKLTYPEDAEGLWGKVYKMNKCRMENVQSKASNDEHYLLEEADLSKKEIECSGQMKLRATYETSKSKDGDKIVCNDGTNKWDWGDGTQVTPTDRFTVGCIKQRYCTACADTIDEACTTSECTKPTPGTTPEGCKTLTCPENSFAISANTNLKSDNGVKCEKKDGVAAWLIYDKDAGKKVTELSCRTTLPCDLTKLKDDKVVKCPEDREGCQEATIGAEDITCPGELKLHKGDEMFTFICDKTEGKHNAGGGPIYCAEEKSADAAGKEEAPSGAGAGMIVGIAFGVIALAAGTGLAVWQGLKYKKRKAAAASKGAPASSTKASNKKSSEQSKSKSAEVKTKDKKESGSDPIVAGDTPKEPAKVEETPKDKVETPGVTPATTAPTTPTTPATPAAPAAPAPAAAPPKSNSDDQTANAPV